MVHVPLGPDDADATKAGDDIEWAVESILDAAKTYAVYDSYYDGDHPLLFATEKFRNTFGNLFQAFADNLCPTVVDAVADRMVVTGFDGDQKNEAEDIWRENRLERNAGQVHQDAFKFGDSYVLVWPDKSGTPVVWPQSPLTCTVEYDDEEFGKILRAGKCWVNNQKYGRLTLYFPDRILRFRTKRALRSEDGAAIPKNPNDWEPLPDGESTVTNPYGETPLYHFANNAGVGQFGTSELRDVIKLQDALNKSLCDMLVGMEFTAWPQRYATGLQIDVDADTGKPINTPFTPGADRIWTAAGDVKFGEFSAGNLEQYVKVQDSIRTEIARVSGTPLHYFNLGGTPPTGEALKVSEGRLVKKVEDRQVAFGDVWKDVLEMSARQRGVEVNEEKDLLKIIWKLASPHNPLLDAEVQIVKQQIGVSTKQSLRELGYSEDKIDEMMKEKEEEAALAMQQQLDASAAMLKIGGGPTDKTSNTGLPSSGQGGQVGTGKTAKFQMKPVAARPSTKETSV